MFIHRIAADYKKRPRKELQLENGWNVVEGAPEDWPETLCAALYGTDTPGDLARIELDCQTGERTLTLCREDASFRAVDADRNAVDDLTAENCGEVLTGAGRELYERTACIRFPAAGDAASEVQARLEREQERLKELEQKEMALNRELRGVDADASGEEMTPVPDAPPDLSVLSAAYDAMKRKLEEDHVPELDAIARLRGGLVNIMTAGRQLDKAEAEQEAAERVLAEAKSGVETLPFAGMTPEEAEQSPLRLPFRPFIPRWLAIAYGAAAALATLFLFRSPGVWYPICWVLFLALGVLSVWLVRKWGERWEVIAAERRKQWESDLAEYIERYRVMEEAQAEADMRISAAETLRESLTTNERAILRDIHKFAPEVSNMTEADEQLRLCARRRKELSIAEAVVRKAEALQAKNSAESLAVAVLRDEAIDKHHIVVANLSEESERDKLVQALNAIREERATLRLEIRRDREALDAPPDPAPYWERARVSLDALTASEAYDGAFPEEFAVRTADIFRALTGPDNAVTPERVAAYLADPDAEAIRTELAAPYGAGAFCLAACVACYTRVLTAEAPLTLVNALSGFDDASRAYALRFFEELSKDRQVILFETDGAETEAET